MFPIISAPNPPATSDRTLARIYSARYAQPGSRGSEARRIRRCHATKRARHRVDLRRYVVAGLNVRDI